MWQHWAQLRWDKERFLNLWGEGMICLHIYFPETFYYGA